MAWTKCSTIPNPLTDSNGDPASGYVLKAYLPGTTTVISLATDSTGGTTVSSMTANANGVFEVSGNEVIPHTDRKMKWGIFATAAHAAANTPFAIGPFDNVEQDSSVSSDNPVPAYIETQLGSAAVADVFTLTLFSYTLGATNTANLMVFRNGQKLTKGTDYTETSTTSVTLTFTPNDGDSFDFIASTTIATAIADASTITYTPAGAGAVATNVQAKLRETVSVKDFGAVGDGVTDDTAKIQAAIDASATLGKVCYVPAGNYLISATLTMTGNDASLHGESMENTFVSPTSAVTGVAIDVNTGGASRYSRGSIKELKILCTKSTSEANWYDDTYYTTHGIRVNNVVNGFKIERVRILRTITAGIEFEANTWFNTLEDVFVENCQGSGIYLKSNSNGVQVTGCRTYLCDVGMTIEDSFAVNISGCGFEDTSDNGLRISGESVVAVTGTWFEDHGLVTTTDGAIDISGVVGNTARPATVSVDGSFFNSVGDYVVKGENAKVTVHGSRSDGSTVNIFNIDADCTLDDGESNFWVFSGNQYEGAGFPAGIVNYDGEWTPVISDAATAGNTATFDANTTSQKYSKRGNQVTIQARLENIDTTGMTAGNILFIQGIPIAASALNYMTGNCQFSEVTLGGVYAVAVQQGSGSTTAFYMTDVNTAATKTSIKVSDVTASTADIFISMTYFI